MENIVGKLERVAALVGSGDALERDLALSLLREVYYDIKFGVQPVVEAEAYLGAEEDAIGLRSERRQRDTSAQDNLAVAVATRSCTDSHPLPPPVPEHVPVSPAPEPAPEPVPEPEPLPLPEPEPEPLPAPAPEPALPVIPRPVAPEVIRSLYGAEGEYEPEPKPVPRPEPRSEHKPQSTHEPAHESEPKPSSTLGDALHSPKTLGETLRSNATAGRPGLKRSIGLNDRFLMIRDMFGGDADAFDRALTRLDAFTDFDEAVIWIHDNFDWSADNPGATLLVGLLERKLGR